ncbi:MAG: hypothetical protein AB1916_12070 [Thermodesulfobacteriota bacterium]
MHPVRQFIIVRWALYVVVVLGVAAFFGTRQPVAPTFTSDVATRLAPKKVQLPDPAVVKTLDSAIAVLKGERVPFGGVDRVESSLIALHREEVTATGQKKMPVSLSAIFMGPPKKYAIINGAVLEAGDRLPDGRILKDIQPDGVVLGVGDVEERFEWLPSFRVELKKPAETPAAAPTGDGQEGGAAAPASPAPQADLQNLPENPTPEQALNILQQLKKQQAKQQ